MQRAVWRLDKVTVIMKGNCCVEDGYEERGSVDIVCVCVCARNQEYLIISEQRNGILCVCVCVCVHTYAYVSASVYV